MMIIIISGLLCTSDGGAGLLQLQFHVMQLFFGRGAGGDIHVCHRVSSESVRQRWTKHRNTHPLDDTTEIMENTHIKQHREIPANTHGCEFTFRQMRRNLLWSRQELEPAALLLTDPERERRLSMEKHTLISAIPA